MYNYLNKIGVKNTLVRGAVNFEIFHPVEVQKDSKKIVIGFPGARKGKKGTAIILAALEIIKKKYPQIQNQTYYDKNIPQEQMAKWYSQADIFVDAQLYGGWNNPVAEAMACKTAVVCSNIGAVEDFGFHNKTALLFKSGDVDNLVEQLELLINDSQLRNRLAEAAHAHIQQFTWDKTAKTLESVLKQV